MNKDVLTQIKRCIKSGLDDLAFSILRSEHTYLSVRDLSTILKYMSKIRKYPRNVVQYICYESAYRSRLDPLYDVGMLLVRAICKGYTDTAMLLLADIRIDDCARTNAIIYAAEGGYLRIVEAVLKEIPRFEDTARGIAMKTAIQEAAKKGHLSVVQLLHADKHCKKEYVSMAIVFACMYSRIHVIMFLLYESAMYEIDSQDFYTFISSAIRAAKTKVVKLLLNDNRVDSVLPELSKIVETYNYTDIVDLFEARMRKIMR